MGAQRSVDCGLDGDGFVGRYFAATATPDAAVLVIGGSAGGLRQGALLARALAETGVSALGVAYHGDPGLPRSLESIPLEYFGRALDWLAVEPEVDPTRIVALGVSRGSEAALLLGVHFPNQVAAVTALVPGNVVLCSWPPGKPAWTLAGTPLPYTGQFGPDCDDPAAVIPVERIGGPIFLLAAGRDEVWPSSAMARAIAERRRLAGLGDEDELLDIPDADHSIGTLTTTPQPGGSNAEQRTDAWEKLLIFIRSVRPNP